MERLTQGSILVTGGTGLVGSHLVKRLISLGAHVVVTYRSQDPFSFFETEQLSDYVQLVQCDLKDKERVFDIVASYEITSIFHLGAQPIVQTAYEYPYETLHTNIMGTVNILEAARLFRKIQAVIVASSDKAYGKSTQMYNEQTALKGDHPYEVSKSSADLISIAYHKTYGIPVVVSRFGNIYGEGDRHFDRIIPGILQAMILDQKIAIRSDGKSIREYLYVEDVVNGYLMLLQHIQTISGQAFNFGTDYAVSVIDLLHHIEAISRKKIRYEIQNTAKNEIPEQRLDWSKAQQQLDWSPKISLEQIFPILYSWYEKYFYKKRLMKLNNYQFNHPAGPSQNEYVIFEK